MTKTSGDARYVFETDLWHGYRVRPTSGNASERATIARLRRARSAYRMHRLGAVRA